MQTRVTKITEIAEIKQKKAWVGVEVGLVVSRGEI